MASVPFLINDDTECLSAPIQLDSLNTSLMNRAFMAVAQEVTELLKQAHSWQTDSINGTEMVMIRSLDPEYRQVMEIEPLTTRELEVLQLIVEGHNNLAIAKKLYVSVGTVKTHVRNILKKLCVNDRTQAAIRALRSGLVY
jgi:DNA-binding NarL/FixJ family response regulator